MAEPVQTLVVRDSTGLERVVALDRDVITIGRDPSCVIRLDSQYVSRQHARIEVRPVGPVLVDLGSRNGTKRNGERVHGEIPLVDGDEVEIADAIIKCLSDEAMDSITRTFVPIKREPAGPPDLLRVDPQAYEVWIGDKQPEKRLSSQEFDLVRYLYENKERVCTRQELGDAIWGAGNWDPNMLHRLVHRLKEKIEPNSEKTRYIQTVPWVGYRVTP
jgi:hypothetical protein